MDSTHSSATVTPRLSGEGAPSPSVRTSSLTSNGRTHSLQGSHHGFSGRPQYGGASPNEADGDRFRYQGPDTLVETPDANQRTHTITSTHSAAHSFRGRNASRTSLDPSNRPSSMRGRNSDKPWIGTFNFEGQQDGAPPLPKNNQTTANGNRKSSEDKDTEKQSKPSSDWEKDAKEEKQKDPNLIDFEGPDDPLNPQNWPMWRKWVITTMFGLMTFVVTFASSVFSTATDPTSQEFGVSTEVMTLGTSLFVLGFAWGPPIWGPLSELYGRKYPLFFGYIIFGIFSIPVAVATNLPTIFICRFFGGFFASAPLAIVGGALADLWNPVQRGYALCVFSGATFIGPAAGPIVGSFVTDSYLGWRWTQWLTLILAESLAFVGFFVIPETLAPRLLHAKAKKIRFETRNWAIRSQQDETKVTGRDIVERYVLRPFTMLAREPILDLITLYMSLIYGILYLFFEVFPITFIEQRGYSDGIGSLPFAALVVGVCFGALIIVLITKYRFAPKLKQLGHVVPEERLVPMFIGGALLPAGLLWFAWTSNPDITPWPQIVSIVPVGAGIMIIFLQGLNYLIDVYLMHANSAIAANTFVRSWVGAGFPMFAMAMYNKLSVPWATSLLGFLCIALYPAPILFFIYGERIRKMSKFSPTA